MGSLSDLLDINNELMAWKVLSHKKQADGLEAPRNSMDLPLDSSYVLYAARDNIRYGYRSPTESYGEDYCCPEAPMKKLISEEISRRPKNKQNTPSVVARLMGVDMLPLDSKPLAKSNISQQQEFGCFNHYDTESQHLDQFKPSKTKLREHPQEEELQKFKKEFEAWQAARFKQCSSMIGVVGNAPIQLIAQEELNREKMFLHANSRGVGNSERPRNYQHLTYPVDPYEALASRSCCKKNKSTYRSSEENESLRLVDRIPEVDFKYSQLMNSDFEVDSSPSRIVILRPGPDRIDTNEGSWNSSPSTSDERNKIEDFLEEVKERLKSEIQGKSSKRSYTVRGGGIETPYWEKSPEPREIARRIAKHARESVNGDLEMNLVRSESTRSYRSEVQFNGTGSPEFINRDTRRFLAERLRNVLKGEASGEVPKFVRSKSRLSMSDNDNNIATQSKDAWMENKTDYPESYTNELKRESRSFRREHANDGFRHEEEEQSPRNLVRSLSAPVSGTSFGKLLLEDRHVLTGAQLMRKHEAMEKASTNAKKQKKDKFNIKEKVSSFRYSLTLRGKLFRRRFKSMSERDQSKDSFFKDIAFEPATTMSFYDTHENSTEVPPSPASVCSSIRKDFWRPADCPSPVSSLGGYQLEDGDISHAFKDISSNLSELRRKLNKLEGSVSNETTNKHSPNEFEADIEDETEAYVRDLLIASGLYDVSFGQNLSKWDPLGKPISNQVYEEVEDARKQHENKADEMNGKDHGDKLNHKMIVDLLNETIPMILRQPANTSKYMEKAIGPFFKPPQGRKLLSHVWNMIRVYVHPPNDRSYYSLDDMLARDLNSEPWARLIDDDMNVLGREIECRIIEDLMGEIVKDM